tara:strand:+ start:10002 stop:10883 length:882 start_codon:yes stop_codon:yes gene_type:complete
MALTYTELVALVRSWCNRDEEVVSDAIIQDALKYAADKAYRTLRVPPLENVAIYESSLLVPATTGTTGSQSSKTEIQLPYDLTEFIQIKELDADGLTIRVFNEKLDIRTFNDNTAEKYAGNNYWARERNVLYLTPGFGYSNQGGNASTIELYYYRRLPALNATYAVTVLNYNVGFLTVSSQGTPGASQLWFNSNTGTTAYATQAEATAASAGGTVTSVYYVGNTTPNWLRDENQRVLLFGALAEVFAYVQEDDQAAKYAAMFRQEIAELNDEDAKRNASGGNLQINFNGRGLI